MFSFFAKNSQQNVFDNILDILESKKVFFKSRTCSDHIKKTIKNKKLYHHFMAYSEINFNDDFDTSISWVKFATTPER